MSALAANETSQGETKTATTTEEETKTKTTPVSFYTNLLPRNVETRVSRLVRSHAVPVRGLRR